MPELAEVDITRQQLMRWLSGATVQSVDLHDQGLLATQDELDKLSCLQDPLIEVKRRGKHLCLVCASADGTLCYALLHLRMTGKLVRSTIPKTSAARLSWQVDEEQWVHFEDSRRLGTLTLHDEDPWLTHPTILAMGPEPHDLTDGAELRARFGKTRRRLKDVLLDQRVIAGVGNIAISELFYAVKIPPKIRAHEVSDAQLDALVAAMPPYFDALIDAHPIDEPMNYVNQPGDAESLFVVYAHEGEECLRCKRATFVRETFGGRSTYYCPVCQAES